MNIHQLSVNYVQEHDRVLVRINTTAGEELRLWLTRRLTIGFLPLLIKVVAQHVARIESAKSPGIAANDPHAQQILADFKREESLQTSDFATPYKDQPGTLPLGADPLLVTEVNMTPLANGQLQFIFSEKLPATEQAGTKPRSFQMALEPKLTHGFMHLLEKAFDTSLWALPPHARLPGPDAAPDDDAGGLALEKPKYLN
jgi:hypothetical protein